MFRPRRLTLAALCLAPLWPLTAARGEVGFNDHIRPILVEHCAGCHGGPKQAGGVSVLYRDDLLARGESGRQTLAPGDPAGSYLIERVSDPDNDFRMPPKEHGPRLSDREVELLTEWVRQGAPWEEHWSFVPPNSPTRPGVTHDDWPQRELDYHVLARLEREGLAPADPAPRGQWLRRVTFDLTGLPPTVAEQQAFIADDRPDAAERVVDRLLDSPQFGERWAAMWMDLARYADTMGYEKDLGRTVWPWRDWLIRTLNADLPYNQFIVKLLAGDLLPKATTDDRLATTFHRHTANNTEGGTDDEEYRLAAVIDRVNTTWQVFQAQTFACVQCHAHPYDGIKHHEYYEFLAVFNNTADCDLDGEEPLLAVPTDPDACEEATALDREASRLRRARHERCAQIAAENSQWAPLEVTSADANQSTELVIKPAAGATEVWTAGTVATQTAYTLVAQPTADAGPITALRIEALPKDTDRALRIPEDGFMLTRLKLSLIPPDGGPPTEVKLRYAFSDEPQPEFDPQESLNKSVAGWAALSKLFRPRWAVFLLDEPLTIPPGAELQLKLRHDRKGSGQLPLVLQRSRYSVSSDERWTGLLADKDFSSTNARLKKIADARSQIPSAPTPVMAERCTAGSRDTFTFIRGNWLERGERVLPGTPESLPPLARTDAGARLDVARWIASDQNPLTARALVNRVWEQLFGLGIVETVEDLGASGSGPSNQPLLDLLAVQFQGEMQWRCKRLLREIVLSSTYRQDARVSAELARRDPRNELLARGPRTRLQAEMIRDQALALSGKLSDKQFGPPVMPYQPKGVWRTVYNGADWRTSEGEDRFRRAVYTFWKRTSAYPSLVAFDMTSREVCTPRRLTTNTPLQALVTLNDPAYVELAGGFGDRMAEHGDTPADQIAWAYQAAAGSPADEESLAALLELYTAARLRFEGEPASAERLAPDADAFARTVLANAILNLDATLSK
ncbi:Planctomycete cytochrome C [Posidoniimonas corsicana]|uniref:Planctomycete cytochrome C n=1 Tax=Posidoniimonas corsicana TaxID=1938618 RepID=A0A5C5UV05_9BACT|nr:PSD1 and planctomycete cytochrome C domain-containing protein [Posidoniimonas corsicana]TWT30186.1 Planctomycete cytochrome C [Posidoniimonas corsicana]